MKQSQGKASPITSGGRRETGFPFRVLDYQAGEAWLNRLGKQGWRLGSAGLGAARSWQTGEPVSYAVTPDQGQKADFRTLCRDAGWDWAARTRGLELYVTRAGARPVPLETDRALECRTFLRRGIRWLAALWLRPAYL